MKLLRKIHNGVNGESGFTILELMIATIVFALFLVVMLASFLQIGKMYYKGISINNTTDTTRSIMDGISNDVRFSTEVACSIKDSQNCPVTGSPNVHYFCIGQHRYTYYLSSTTPYKIQGSDINNPNSGNNPKGIIMDTITGCPPPTVAGTSPTQLMKPNMQLNDLNFYCVNNFCYVHLHIAYYGVNDSVFSSPTHFADTSSDHTAALLDKDNYCSGSSLGTEFCAVSDLSAVAGIGS
jgi:hypothetical protein